MKIAPLQKIVTTLFIMLIMLSQIFTGSVVAAAHNMTDMQNDVVMEREANIVTGLETRITADFSCNESDCKDYDCTSVHCISAVLIDKIHFTWQFQNLQIPNYLDVILSQNTSLLYRPPIA